MSVDFGAAIRTALINDVVAAGLITEWEGEPAVFTRTPVPGDVLFPFVIVSPNIAYVDEGTLSDERPNVVRDIFVYGNQPDQYRVVETIANRIQSLFHRTRFSITVAEYNIVLITASGPHQAPADDDKSVARVVTLTILAQRA